MIPSLLALYDVFVDALRSTTFEFTLKGSFVLAALVVAALVFIFRAL